MIREKEKYYGPLLFFLDSISTFVSYGLSLYFYLWFFHPHFIKYWFLKLGVYFFEETIFIIPFLVVFFIFFNQFVRKNDYIYKRKAVDILYQIFSPLFVIIAVFLIFFIINPLFRVNPWFIVIYGTILCSFLFFDRMLISFYINLLQRKGRVTRYILIVGTNKKAINTAQLFNAHVEWGFKVVGFLTYEVEEVGKEVYGFKVLGAVDDIIFVLEKNVVDLVLLCQERENLKDLQTLALRCKTLGIDFVLDTNVFVQNIRKITFDSVDNSYFIVFRSIWLSPEKLLIKRMIDILISGIGIIICIPLWIVIPILIKRDSEGPAFYIQERVGKNGRLFKMYKFRTMVMGAEKMQSELLHLNQMDGPVFKIKDDPRLTKIGKLLRRTSLDELPQLFNVLAGDMSLVGPRPPILKEVL